MIMIDLHLTCTYNPNYMQVLVEIGLKTIDERAMNNNDNNTIESESSSIKNEFMNLGISNDLQIISFSHIFNEIALHFQIICLPKQIYAWIGCNSTKFGHLYAGAPTRPNNIVSVSSLLGGTSDNTGAAIARRVVMKTGVPVMLACNIPKDSPLLEVEAEKKLVQKLNALGYTKSRRQGSSS